MDDFVACDSPGNRAARMESYRFKQFRYDELEGMVAGSFFPTTLTNVIIHRHNLQNRQNIPAHSCGGG